MNCFKPRAAPAAGPKSESDPDRVAGCIFCDVSKDRGFDVVYEVDLMMYNALHNLANQDHQDADYVAFKDIRPAALHHIQVVPKRHIGKLKGYRADNMA
jgi:diadenosine tetraphosphate (Ap4A) HIT family hydrolase